MKILANLTCYCHEKPTGIDRFALHIARELCRIDPATVSVSSGPLPGIPNTITSNLLSRSTSVLTRYEYLARAIWDQTAFRSIVRKQEPDIVFFPIQDGLVCPPVKQIVTVHDLHYLHFSGGLRDCKNEISHIRSLFYRFKMPRILKDSAAVVAVSEATKRDLVASFDIDPAKVHVIHNGYDDSQFRIIDDPQKVLDRYGLAAGGYFFFLGSILRHKNIVRIIKAFEPLQKKAVLVLAGACKDPLYLQEIKDMIHGLGIASVRYLEYVKDDELPSLYSGAIAYLLPSLHEGFGIPIIEAMACGTPVITSNSSSMQEVAGDAALLVDPFSVDSITSAMGYFLDDREVAARFKIAGREHAKQFTWVGAARKLYQVAKNVVETGGK